MCPITYGSQRPTATVSAKHVPKFIGLMNHGPGWTRFRSSSVRTVSRDISLLPTLPAA